MPGTTEITFDNEDLSATALNHIKKLRSAKDRPYRVARDVMQFAQMEDAPADLITVRWETEDHSRPTRVQTGYETYDNFAQATLTPGTAQWAIVVQPIFISDVDIKKNSGRHKIIDLTEVRTKNVERHMHRSLQKAVLNGPLASGSITATTGFEDLLHLNGVDHPSTGGFLEGALGGSGSFHGISRVTFPIASHIQLHNMYENVASDASANLLPLLYAISVEAELRAEDMLDGPSLRWYVSKNVARFGKDILRSSERYTGTDLDDQRGKFMMIGGIPLVPLAASDLPQTGATSATTKVSGYLVDWKEAIVPYVVSDWDMNLTEFVDVPGTTGPTKVALMRLWMQNICMWPGACAVLGNAETY